MYYFRQGQRRELTRDRYIEFCRVANQLTHLHAIVGTKFADYPPPPGISSDSGPWPSIPENTFGR